ncbi:unnamed protein product [Periconia digitata]|uniref:Protein kinase domain-containing protein n=1 Tax=Periconia digitata TaxID=1303443 RepID=A0A9W4UR50_9PLEO|nr:unnamed protein product [Periconia digitata]
MRLLECVGEDKLVLTRELFGDDEIPPYAILSHTWKDGDEVTFSEFNESTGKAKSGYKKIQSCGQQVRRDGLQYFWVDTCCIDKSSSAELQEAINSMFRWYQDAAICYVYLSDVSIQEHLPDISWESTFQESRWFTRGWTLQELIAPKHVEFFTQDWVRLGTKSTLETSISNVTGISLEVLRGRPVAECTIKERLGWAKARATKREEDHVYSLLGILDVTMPMIYGEGKAKALRRLYDELSRHTPVEFELLSDADCNDSIQELVSLQSTIQRLEARLRTTLSTQSYSSDYQGSTNLPAIYQSSLKHKENPKPISNSARMQMEITRTSHSSGLRLLIHKLTQMLSVLVAPFGYFEILSSFFPEAYTMQNIGPQIVCYSCYQTEKNSMFVTFTQDLLVAKHQRRWVRIKLRMLVATGSVYWRFVAQNKVRQTSDDTEINMSLVKAPDAATKDSQFEAISLTKMLGTSTENNTRNSTEVLRHRNVRTIPETALVTAHLVGTLLVANVDNHWVIYRTITAGKSSMELLLRNIKSSIALRGASYVAQMIGVVIDPETNLFKGMLVETPAKGSMFVLMDIHRSRGKPIPWPIRQKWAKQIVHGVAAYHERCQVIGGLRTYSYCISIDEHGDAIILGLSPGIHPCIPGGDGLLPPEYRAEAFEKGNGEVGPEFDVFQLGLLLWHLYRDQHQQGASTFCSLSGCNNKPSDCNIHKNPVALPKAGAGVPDYLDQIIALCRQESPRERPAAWELIPMFPTDEEIFRQIDLLDSDERVLSKDCNGTAVKDKLLRLEAIRDTYGNNIVVCAICRERCVEMYYYCDICDGGNFDLCHMCFGKGTHCFVRTHLLAKFSLVAHKNKDLSERLIVYSSVNEEGNREEFVI